MAFVVGRELVAFALREKKEKEKRISSRLLRTEGKLLSNQERERAP
jgi:hypothetical protein